MIYLPYQLFKMKLSGYSSFVLATTDFLLAVFLVAFGIFVFFGRCFRLFLTRYFSGRAIRNRFLRNSLPVSKVFKMFLARDSIERTDDVSTESSVRSEEPSFVGINGPDFFSAWSSSTSVDVFGMTKPAFGGEANFILVVLPMVDVEVRLVELLVGDEDLACASLISFSSFSFSFSFSSFSLSCFRFALINPRSSFELSSKKRL